MKQFSIKILVTLSAALWCMPAVSAVWGYNSVFIPRSQTSNGARDLAGWPHLSLHDAFNPESTTSRHSFTITPEYTNSFRGGALANYLFGRSSLVFSGGRVTDRGADDIFADYFGLPTDFKSTVNFSPSIRNFILDFGFESNLDCIANGLYFSAHVPFVHSIWDLGMKETVSSAGVQRYVTGYMGTNTIRDSVSGRMFLTVPFERSSLAANVEEAFKGGHIFGDMLTPLKYGKIDGRQVRTMLSDATVQLGYRFGNKPAWHAGVALVGGIPGGNQIENTYLFEPLIGNQRHGSIGANFSAHARLWHDEDNCAATWYMDLQVLSLLKNTQLRSYDLINGPGSRYMLLAEIGTPVIGLLVGDGGPASPNQYQGRLINAINETTLLTSIKVPWQIDFATKLSFTYKQCTLDVGYNLWARAAETIVCRTPMVNNKYGIKGDSQMYGYISDGLSFRLSPTQSKATLHGGQGNGNADLTNSNIDSPVQAYNAEALVNFPGSALQDPPSIGSANVNTSYPTILLTDADINVQSGLSPQALSHKVFAHLHHYWEASDNSPTPYVGFGAEAEFGSRVKGSTTCAASALSQWGVWLKGGISFDGCCSRKACKKVASCGKKVNDVQA
jgi:hypothetical protein